MESPLLKLSRARLKINPKIIVVSGLFLDPSSSVTGSVHVLYMEVSGVYSIQYSRSRNLINWWQALPDMLQPATAHPRDWPYHALLKSFIFNFIIGEVCLLRNLHGNVN